MGAEPNEAGSGITAETEAVISSTQDSCSDSANTSSNAVGAIFSSPKLLLSGTCTTNPFAMRSSPNRMTGSEASSGDNSSAPSIIAPSKFGALPSPIGSTFSANPQLHESSGNSLIKLINNNKSH